METNLNDLYTDYNAIENIDIQLAIGLQQFELQGWKVTSSSAMKFQVIQALCLINDGPIVTLLGTRWQSYTVLGWWRH